MKKEIPKQRKLSKVAPNQTKTTPEAIQTKRQQMVSQSARVQQLKARQEMVNNSSRVKGVAQRMANKTGLPNQLKAGVENLSGISMDDVKVHYNSSKPAQLQAHAYAQGTDIHLAPGQEKHLPHEAWHVVQQKQGRVQPTLQMKEKVNINDDASLEKEADVMGAKAMGAGEGKGKTSQRKSQGQTTQLIDKTKSKGRRGQMTPDPYRQTVASMSPQRFIADQFLEAHIRNYSKLKGETEQSYAIKEGKRRGVPAQTVVFVDGTAMKNLLREAQQRNMNQYYYKQILRRGAPAATYLHSDNVFHYVTVVATGGGNYAVQTEAIGRIIYTVKNLGKKVGGVPLYMINHLEAMSPTREIAHHPAGVEEEPEEHEHSDDESVQGKFERLPDATPLQRKSATTGGGVVQRQITLTDTGKTIDYNGALGQLFSKGIIRDADLANAIEPIIQKFDKTNRTFASLQAMFEAAMQALEASDSEEEEATGAGEVEKPLRFWRDENPKLAANNLKEQGYVKGASLRARQGMDYKTVDKDAYEVRGHPRLALVIRVNRPPGAGSLTAEIVTLRKLARAGLPTAKIVKYGYYPIGGVAHPCLLMQQYLTSSKTLIRRVKGHIVPNKNLARNIQVFNTQEMCQRGIASLENIEGILRSRSALAVDDVQFLVDHDGTFKINDASETDSKHIGANIEVIRELIDLLGRRMGEVPRERVAAVPVAAPAPAPAPTAPADSELGRRVREASHEPQNQAPPGHSDEALIEVSPGVFLPNPGFGARDFGSEGGTMTDFHGQ